MPPNSRWGSASGTPAHPDGRRFNTQILVEHDGSIVGTYHKVHLPGHREHEPWREFQHLERRYFEPGDSFDTWPCFGGVVGLATCNDRRWPETYRVLALNGAELILIGYNTPKHYAPDPTQNPLQGFHNQLVMQAGAYQNGCYVVGTKGGDEEGVPSLAERIIAPSGEIIVDCHTEADEVVTAEIDLNLTTKYPETLFDERYRRPETYGPITAQKGATPHPHRRSGQLSSPLTARPSRSAITTIICSRPCVTSCGSPHRRTAVHHRASAGAARC